MDFQNEKELLAEVYDIGEKLYATMCSKEKKARGTMTLLSFSPSLEEHS